MEHEIRGVWLHALPEPDDLDFDRPLDPAMLDVADELPAATFELLTGYYRQAASTLRSAFEIMLAGSHAAITNGRRGDFSYRASSQGVGGSVRAAQLDARLRVVCSRCVFADARHAPWCGDLYSRLTDYAHAKPGCRLGDIRRSNGPIYVEKTVREIHDLFVETFCFVCVLSVLARDGFVLPKESRALLSSKDVTLPEIAVASFQELFPESLS